MNQLIKIHPADNTAVALQPLNAGQSVRLDGREIIVSAQIPAGHKLCLSPIKAGEPVIKYGFPIGLAREEILPGQHIHTHNLATGLQEQAEYQYSPKLPDTPPVTVSSFLGYRRENGKAGIRNEIWIIPTVGCVNSIARNLESQAQALVRGGVEGIYAFPHPYGCSQLGEDHLNTQLALAGLVNHPNAGGVLVLGLGCENNNIPEFQKILGYWNPSRVKFLNCQDCPDEMADGLTLLEELVCAAAADQRQEIPASELVIGLKCGGSDGFSGITANPLTGVFSDRLTAQGGTAILTEVPEMFGAETILMNRCKNRQVFEKTVSLINEFKDYFTRNGQTVYENPSPGNKAGGISTLEDKSLGCIQKGGSSVVTDVLDYGAPVCEKGLILLQGPGNDLVASTALAVSGAHLIIFTTGRGTPFGSPVPTVKVATNTELAVRKHGWIDFNAGKLLEGVSMETLAEDFFQLILDTASGKQLTKTEQHGIRDLAIFKSGVTL